MKYKLTRPRVQLMCLHKKPEGGMCSGEIVYTQLVIHGDGSMEALPWCLRHYPREGMPVLVEGYLEIKAVR